MQWAMAKGHNIGKTVSYRMTAEAARLEIEDNEAQAQLVTWSNEFLGRRDNDRVYPAPIIRGEQTTRDSSITVDMNVTEENEKRP